jgi:hypothetical protein
VALRFPVLFLDFVDFSSLRLPSSLYRPLFLPTLLCGPRYGRSFLSLQFIVLKPPLSLPSRHPLFYFTFCVLCFIACTSRIGFLWCLSVLDYGFGMFVFGIAFTAAVYRHLSRPTSILAALFLPHASSPSSSPPVSLLLCLLPLSSLCHSPFVASLLSRPLLVFSVVPLRRLHLGISTFSSGLRPLTSVWFFVRRSRRLLGSRVDSRPYEGGTVTNAGLSPTCGTWYFSSHFSPVDH